MLVHLEKNQNFKELTAKGTVIVDFFATWCGPCKMLTPELEDLTEEHPEITVVKVDVDQFNDLAAEFNVRAVPTLFLFKDGKNVKSQAGYMDKDAVLAWANRD